MTNFEIDAEITIQVKSERKITRRILELIVIAERQRLPEERGFKSTYDWLIRRHGYSSSAAHRRIQAARLLREVPEIAVKVESGAVNLTTLAQTQQVIRGQEKATGNKVSRDKKKEALAKIEDKTSQKAEQELLSLFPEAEKSGEKVSQKRQGGLRLTLDFTEEEAEELKRSRELLSHTLPGATYSQVVVWLAKAHNAKGRNAAPAARRSTAPAARCSTAGCTYKDPVTGRICGSRYQLEWDHIVPKAKGGSKDPSNLRVLCRRHNQLMAEKHFGREFMDFCRQCSI